MKHTVSKSESKIESGDKIIQLMRPGAMGDILMATSVLPALKSKGYKIRFIAHPNYASIVERHPLIDDLLIMRTANKESLIRETQHMPRAERTVFLRYPFYVKRDLPEHPIPLHVTDYFCDLVGVPRSNTLHLSLTEEQLDWGRAYEGKVLIHTSTLWSPYKNWPLDRWAAFAKKVQTELGLEVLQVGGPKDKPVEGVPKVEAPSVHHACAAIKYSKLFVGLDSLFNHVTQALEKPSIILWGSTHPQGHGYTQNVNLVNNVVWRPEMGAYGPSLTCQPCYREYSGPGNNNNQRACPYTVPYNYHTLPEKMHAEPELNACMASFAVDTVFYHAKRMLEGQHKTAFSPAEAVLTW